MNSVLIRNDIDFSTRVSISRYIKTSTIKFFPNQAFQEGIIEMLKRRRYLIIHLVFEEIFLHINFK